MKKINIFLVFFISFINCQKESKTTYTANLLNRCSHDIKIEYLINGVVRNIIQLPINGSFQIAKNFDRGIVNHGGFSSNYVGDSAIVFFDDTIKMIHYVHTPVSPIKKSYLYTSNRNIFNYLSYDYSYTDESKHVRKAIYDYTFTEQDYLDAK